MTTKIPPEIRCERCVYWDPGDDGWGECRKGESVRGRPEMETDAYADDGEYRCFLNTRPGFGCRMFEDRTAPIIDHEGGDDDD